MILTSNYKHMKTKRYLWSVTLFFVIVLPQFLFAQEFNVSGISYSEIAKSDTSISEYLESWNDLYLSYSNFRVGLRLSIHKPAAEFSQQADVFGLSQRFLEYSNNGIKIRLGNFYTLLGRGLILRSFENRTLRWDSNIDGAKVQFNHSLFDIQVIAGKPRKARLNIEELKKDNPPVAGYKLPAIYGGDIKIKPYNQFYFGGTYVYSEKDNQHTEGFHRGSFFSEIDFDFGSLYGEYAMLPYPKSYSIEDGKALYLSSNLFIGDLTILGEYKSYKNFAFYDGLMNNPPTVIHEHLFTLLNRHQLVQNSNDEKGFLLELNYPITEDGFASFSYSLTKDYSGNKVYSDIYGQYEMSEFLNGDWLWAVAQQTEYSRSYLHFVASASYEISDHYSVKTIYEHLQASDEATNPDRKYYDQLLTIGLSKAPSWTFSIIGEHSTDHTVSKEYIPGKVKTKHFYWMGAQLDFNVFGNIDISIFAGTRQKGKVCIGGVCVVKPELKGVELTLTGRF